MEGGAFAARMGLARKAVLLVTIALLPLGLIAVWQTDKIFNDQREAQKQALLAVTEKAATREGQIFERAIGVAAAMGNTAHSLIASPEMCYFALSNFESGSLFYSYVGYSEAATGRGCSSRGATAPLADSLLDDIIERQELGIYVKSDTANEQKSVLVVATPVFENGMYVGHAQLHIPNSGIVTGIEAIEGVRPLGLVTFNANGVILTSENPRDSARALLPGDLNLADLAREEPYIFAAVAEDGTERTYALMPLVPGKAYAIGTWGQDVDILSSQSPYWRTMLLAVLMWLASVAVVFLIMQVLVIRGVRRLKQQVRLFQDHRTIFEGEIPASGELYELETDFRRMAETILREEARLEDAVHEKNVLLKEVHHRVKNNLQLINSIINMILRGNPGDETHRVVSHLQKRVMALAAVHRSIYQAQAMDRVEADEILHDIVRQSAAVGLPQGSKVALETQIDEVTLYPDQAVPLSLLVSEALTNAIKYAGGEAPRIAVELTTAPNPEAPEVTCAHLTISNTVDDAPDPTKGTGLGAQLIHAFCQQLEAASLTEVKDGIYNLSVKFDVADFTPDDTPLRAAE